MSAPLPASIGFAAGLLGEEAVRMDVLAHGPGWVALAKPSGVAFEEHPWQHGAPTLLGQLRAQLEAAKPEMVRLGLAEPAAVFGPEPETAGIAILADRATAMAGWAWNAPLGARLGEELASPHVSPCPRGHHGAAHASHPYGLGI
jgi:hypothetical protein